MNNLAFDDLRLFLRVAALRNLSAVARERSVPASQVSRSLVRIEKMCGSRLIHRSTHGLALTVSGEAFLNYCHQISGIAEEMEGEFASQSGEQCSCQAEMCWYGLQYQFRLWPGPPFGH